MEMEEPEFNLYWGNDSGNEVEIFGCKADRKSLTHFMWYVREKIDNVCVFYSGV